MSRVRLLSCCVIVVGVLVAVVVNAADVSAGDVATRLGFSAGAAPLKVRAANGGSLSARGCGSCHAAVYADWATTRHAAAWSNAVFLDGLAREPLPRCVHCHAPLVPQKLEAGPIGINAPKMPRVATTTDPSTSLLHEGITCVVCHVRDGAVLVADDVAPTDGTPMHPVRVERALKDPALCASCHQFGFTDSDVLMQDTYGEWRRYADDGGTETCQSCHMPGGRHLFRGAWDVELLKRSLRVDVENNALVLRSVGVGHHFPTGDLFRHLTVEVDVGRGFVDVFRIGRLFAGAGTGKHVVEDTALQPGVPRRVVLPTTTTAKKETAKGRWRVRYHYAEARHERAGVVEPVEIAAGRW